MKQLAPKTATTTTMDVEMEDASEPPPRPSIHNSATSSRHEPDELAMLYARLPGLLVLKRSVKEGQDSVVQSLAMVRAEIQDLEGVPLNCNR